MASSAAVAMRCEGRANRGHTGGAVLADDTSRAPGQFARAVAWQRETHVLRAREARATVGARATTAHAQARLDERTALGPRWRCVGRVPTWPAAASLQVAVCRVASEVRRHAVADGRTQRSIERRQFSVALAQVGCLTQVGDDDRALFRNPSASLVLVGVVWSRLHATRPRSRLF